MLVPMCHNRRKAEQYDTRGKQKELQVWTANRKTDWTLGKPQLNALGEKQSEPRRLSGGTVTWEKLMQKVSSDKDRTCVVKRRFVPRVFRVLLGVNCSAQALGRAVVMFGSFAVSGLKSSWFCTG